MFSFSSSNREREREDALPHRLAAPPSPSDALPLSLESPSNTALPIEDAEETPLKMNAIDASEVAMPLGGSSPTYFKPAGRAMSSAVKAASFGVIIFSSIVLILVVHTLKSTEKMTANWGDFALHPILMTLAFGFLAPVALISYRLLEDVFGMSHKVAKTIHGTLLTAALFCGILGVVDMWIVHDAKPPVAGEGASFHLISVHSWLGLAALIAFALQWLTGAFYYFTGVASISSKQAWMPVHILAGSFAAFGTLASITLGILSFAYPPALIAAKGIDKDHPAVGTPAFVTPEQMQLKVATVFVMLTALCLAIALARH